VSLPPSQTDPPRPAAPTSHRKTRSGSELARRLAPPLAAVAAVVVVILLLLVLNSRPSASGPAPGAVAQPPTSATSAPLSSPPILTTTSPSAVPSATPVATVPVNQPPATQPPATAAPAHPPVTVLNNSRRSGLAAHVAAEVRAKGWSVAKTGNFRGRIVETTLYYAPGQGAAATALAHQMPQIRRVAPRFAGLPGSGLTLVVTRDWSG